MGSPLARLPRGAAMRRPDRTTKVAPLAAAEAVVTPPVGVRVLNRMTFGIRPGDLEAFLSLGATDGQRVAAYAAAQLDPASIDDSALAARIAAAGYTTLNKTLPQLWADHFLSPDPAVQEAPLAELVASSLMRAVYSHRGLVEVLADFWHNLFSIYGPKIPAAMVHFDRDVIRPNLLGNYRSMLEDVARSPAMLFYLDNAMSTDAGPNENYARELCEFHSLGEQNYHGVIQQSMVPVDGQGRPVGYVDEDVYEITRCFTGWTIDPATGLFQYREEWHDRFQKHVLGALLPSNQPSMKDGLDVLDLLASHPGTGRHIADRLCRRLFSDAPPASVVQQAADTFTAQWQAPDQLRQVVEVILLSPAFRDTFGEKTKRPYEQMVSALRAGAAEIHGGIDRPELASAFDLLARAGQRPFTRLSPDGFPDDAAYWSGTTPRAMGLRLLNEITEVTDSITGAPWVDLAAQTPPSVRSASALADFWIDRILHRPMDPAGRQEVVDFMAQGRNPDLDLPIDTDPALAARVRAMVGLILMSPDFTWR